MSEQNKIDEIMWECPSCGFAFDATHQDIDPVTGKGNGNYTCPLCELVEQDAEIELLKAEIERKDEALRFYAEEENYQAKIMETEWGPNIAIVKDGGKRAREAL